MIVSPHSLPLTPIYAPLQYRSFLFATLLYKTPNPKPRGKEITSGSTQQRQVNGTSSGLHPDKAEEATRWWESGNIEVIQELCRDNKEIREIDGVLAVETTNRPILNWVRGLGVWFQT